MDMFTNLMLIMDTLIRQVLIKICQLFISILWESIKCFNSLKKIFFIGLTVLSDFTNTTSSLSCISIKNQECEIRPQVVNINSNNPIFYPFSIKISKCSANCNDINDPYAKICVPDIIKKLNVKVFNLM